MENELTEHQKEINSWYRHEVLNNRSIYPELYNLEIRKNNFKISGNVFGFRRG